MAKRKAKKKSKKVGRPTKYKEEYCQKLIDHMAQGYSYESFAAVIDVNRDTIYHWEKLHPRFSDAKKIARAKCLLFWEEQGMEGLWNETHYDDEGNIMSKKSINATMWIFNMKNRFNWKDKVESEENLNLKFPSLKYDPKKIKDDIDD